MINEYIRLNYELFDNKGERVTESKNIHRGTKQNFVWDLSIPVKETHLTAGPDGRVPTSRHKVRKCAAKSH